MLQRQSAMTDKPFASPPLDENTARLLEQLLRIARISALEETASGIAHELNQPIGAIATFAQAAERMLSRDPPMVQEAQEVLRHITNESMGAGECIHRIRYIFTDRDGARETCSLLDVIEELLPIAKLLATRAGIEVQLQVQDDLPLVSIDRLRIQHVLFTLLQNALEAPPQADAPPMILIDVTGTRYEVRTSIRDRGAGLSAEARQQLFRPFFTTKRHGTGLGLASSRAIIEAHQGHIGVEDAEGGGAGFWFTLPAAAQNTAI
jgi:C4-dicarboxylate-specific signal transduction histidine kinase